MSIVTIALLFSITLPAQEFTIDYFGSEEAGSSSQDQPENRSWGQDAGEQIVVVPFNQKLYFNDAHKSFADSSGLNHDQIIIFLREQLDQYLIEALDDTASGRSILQSSTLASSTPLERVYHLLSYQMADAEAYKSDHSRFFPKSKLSRGKEEEARSGGLQNGEVVSPIRDRTAQYVNVIVNDNDVFDYLDEGGPARAYLFINQFEIKADYSDPYKTASGQNQNLIRVHYSVFDHRGRFVHGNYAAVAYPAHVSNLETLAGEYFAPLCKQIIRSIPYEKL